MRTTSMLVVAITGLWLATAVCAQPQMTVEEARGLLRRGFDLRGQGRYHEAIEVLQRVVAFDPALEADFPEEKIHLLAAGVVCGGPTGAVAAPQELSQALAHLGNREVGGDREVEAAVPLLEVAFSKALSDDDRDQAVLLLGLCYQWLHQCDRAIPRLEALAARRPTLKVSFPDQKISDISPLTGLGFCYKAKGDWQKAADVWERFLRIQPNAQRILTNLAEARRELAKAGNLAAPPMAVVKGRYVPSYSQVAVGWLLVSGPELAQALRIHYAQDSRTGEARLSGGGKTLVVPADGGAPGATRSLTASPPPPEASLGKKLVPLRVVAEHFGAKVQWEPLARIAWVN